MLSLLPLPTKKIHICISDFFYGTVMNWFGLIEGHLKHMKLMEDE